MENGISEATQVLDIGIKGMDTALRLSGSFVNWSIEELARLVKFIVAQKKTYNLKPGEMPLDKMLSYNANVQADTLIMQIDEKIVPEFEEYCKTNNLSYSFLYDVNKTDGQVEIAYSQDQESAFTTFISRWSPLARDYSFNEYVQNADPDEIEAVEEELLDTMGKEKKESYNKDGQVTFAELASMSNHMTVLTMDLDQFNKFNEEASGNDIRYHVINRDDDRCSAVLLTSDCSKMTMIKEGQGVIKQNLAEFLNENRKIIPDKVMTEAAKTGISSSKNKEDIILIDSKQIKEVNEYSVKIRVMEDDKTAYINVPVNQIYKSDIPGKFNLLIHKGEIMSVYGSDAFTRVKGNETISVPQIANKRVAGSEIAEMAKNMEHVYEEKSRESDKEDRKLSDFFVNTPYEDVPKENTEDLQKIEPESKDADIIKNASILAEAGISAEESIPAETSIQTNAGISTREGRKDRYIDISIDKESLDVRLKGDFVTSRVPKTWGYGERRLMIPRNEVKESHNGRAILVRLDKDKEYDLYDAGCNMVVETKLGFDLFAKHYDPSIYKRGKDSNNRTKNTRNERNTRSTGRNRRQR